MGTKTTIEPRARAGLARACATLLACVAMALPSPVLAHAPTELEQQQIAYAKQLYGEGVTALEAANYPLAVQKFEEAYRYAPNLHVFNFNIGTAAHSAGDCAKAKLAFQRFLDLVPAHAERKTAQEKLLEIERSGCAAPPPPVVAPTPTGPEENPIAEQDRDRDAAAAAAEAADEKPKKPKKARKYRYNGLMIGGMVSGGVGVVLLVAGTATGIVERRKAREVQDAADSVSTLFFPDVHYTEDGIREADQLRQRLGPATVGLLVAAGALAITGAALYAVGLKKCRASGKSAARGGVRLATLGPALVRGGAGLAAVGSFGRRRAGPSRCT
jgi:tetratricopeptide (TPR) repeat protein